MPTSPALPQPVPLGYPRVSPCLCVDGAVAAIAFNASGFGAETHMRLDAPDGSVAHAELAIGPSLVMLGDPFGHVWSLATHAEDVAPEEFQRRFAAMFATAQQADPGAGLR